ncbi:MAG: hypothetical protein M0Q21_08435 [Ignavibacteriaceae bacterium]|nr:hypothetical protein [Ignavibacteriaceae bacterium]
MGRRHFSTLILFLLFLIEISAQQNPGAKSISLANADVALNSDAFSLFTNPSGLAQMNWTEGGVFYSPSPFGVNELSNTFFAASIPTKYGSLGFGVTNYGFELYKENKFVLAYANRYAKNFFYGLSLSLNHLSIKNYGQDNALVFSLGALYYVSPDFRFAFTAYNLNKASWGKEKNQIPTVYKSGISYDVLQNVSLNLALENEVGFNPSLQCGINYDINEYFSLRSGFANEPTKYSAGFGIHYSQFEIDYAIFTHQELGLTHQFSVLFGLETLENRADKIRKYLGF